MSNKLETAARLHAEGFNCAQAVIGAFADSLGFDQLTALKFAGSFGGGLRVGEVCGAVSGAAMVLGIKYGQTIPFDKQAKEENGKITAQFADEYRRRMGALTCRDLLGYDMRDPEMKALLFPIRNKAVCQGAIDMAVIMLEEMGF